MRGVSARAVAAAFLVLIAACGTGSDDASLQPLDDTSAATVSTTEASSTTTTPAVTAPEPIVTPAVDTPSVDTTSPTPPADPTPASSVALGQPSDCVRVTDFDTADWVIVNDGVMGGQSVGAGMIVDGILVFAGTIVTRGGGFSSVRGAIDGELAGATELVMRVRADGRSYELLVDDEPTRRQRVTHYAPIDAAGGDWEEVAVPLSDMDARVFGTPVEAEPFQPDLATEIGVILSDGLDGPFSFEIDWIDACA